MSNLLERLADALHRAELDAWDVDANGPFEPSAELSEARRTIAETRVITAGNRFVAQDDTDIETEPYLQGEQAAFDLWTPGIAAGLELGQSVDVTILVRIGATNG